MIYLEIGKNIKHYRQKRKITQKQLAEMVGKSYSVIQKYEIGLVEPPLSVLEKIAAVLGVSLHLLYGVSEEEAAGLVFAKSHGFQGASGDSLHKEIIEAFDELNDAGKSVAIQRIKELTEIERYTSKNTPSE